MNKLRYYILLLPVLLSCEKTITITPPAYTEKVSIQCMLEADSLPVLYYNRTVPYFDGSITFGQLVIRNAVINISDGSLSDSLQLDSVYDKIYCEYNYYYKGHIPVQVNSTYNLTITDRGNTYTASCNTNNIAVATVDSTEYIANYKDLYGEHEGVKVYFHHPASVQGYYRYEMDRYIDTATTKAEVKIASVCLGRDSLAVQELGRAVYSGTGDLSIVIEPAYSHKPGTKGAIRIQTMDKNGYDFFDQLDQQKVAQYNPFIEPVFLRQGQFGSNAIGYFSAMLRSPAFEFIYPE